MSKTQLHCPTCRCVEHERTCRRCGTRFVVGVGNRKASALFCSEKCKNAHNQALRRARLRRATIGQPPT